MSIYSSSYFQLFLVERAGRRSLHLLGLAGMSIAAILMCISLLLVSVLMCLLYFSSIQSIPPSISLHLSFSSPLSLPAYVIATPTVSLSFSLSPSFSLSLSICLSLISLCSEKHIGDELCGHLCCDAVCGHVRAGPRSNPMVHCGRAVLPGAAACRHGRGWLLQLDGQLHRWNQLPQISGE